MQSGMELKTRLQEDMKAAMKAGEKVTLGTIRMVQAKILEREIELRTSKGRDYHLSDEEILEVLASYAKQRRQSIESYQLAGRTDLADREKTELEVVERYLPKPLSPQELVEIVDRMIDQQQASSLKDLGRVIKAVMAEAKGAADGKIVNQVVKERLVARHGGQ